MKTYKEEIIWNPQEIELKSMQIIEEYLKGYNFSPLEKDIVKRIIHTTGDPEIIKYIRFHPKAASVGWETIKKGANIFTDVSMLASGINLKKLNEYGGKKYCSIADPEIAQKADKWGITRAAASMRKYSLSLNGSIVAIGNAPTALFELLELIENGIAKPALIIGTPVGFVGAAESKDLMIMKNLVPYITVIGTRGGSPIAASIVNALLYHEK